MKSFCRLKNLLTTAPVLVYPRFSPGCSFILETDVSTVGLGAVLSQEQSNGIVHPIAFASHSVDKHERNYGISELETLGLVWAICYFHTYLLGHRCIAYTDHAACLSILNCARPSGKLVRWALTVQEMDITIKHKSGKCNSNADALSRCPSDSPVPSNEDQKTESCVAAVQQCAEANSSPHLAKVSSYQQKDPEMASMLAYLVNGILPEDDKVSRRLVLESKQFEVTDGVLYHENSVVPG